MCKNWFWQFIISQTHFADDCPERVAVLLLLPLHNRIQELENESQSRDHFLSRMYSACEGVVLGELKASGSEFLDQIVVMCYHTIPKLQKKWHFLICRHIQSLTLLHPPSWFLSCYWLILGVSFSFIVWKTNFGLKETKTLKRTSALTCFDIFEVQTSKEEVYPCDTEVYRAASSTQRLNLFIWCQNSRRMRLGGDRKSNVRALTVI